MKLQLATTLMMALEFLSSAPAARAQADSQVQAVRESLSGQRFLTTYREGGALYGTFYSLDVQFCPSGTYVTGGRSEKKTVLGNDQVNTWTEVGRWDVLAYRGQAVLKSVSAGGRTTFIPVNVMPDGRLWLGDGVYVQRTGAAACQ
jgi:hypothetical protein